MHKSLDGKTIECVKGDITELKVDAIVNAANENLAHGGGVARAISKAGGPQIQKESCEWVKQYGPVKTGTAAVTRAGRLNASYVIHAVGPIMGSGQEDEKLRSATHSALNLAETKKIKSIAFPAISTGIYGYPVDKCAHIMILESIRFFKSSHFIKKIIFCLFDERSFKIFTGTLSNQ